MKTFCTPLELCHFAKANLQLKLEGKKLTRALLDAILKEERKNPNYPLAIVKLILLLSKVSSSTQQFKIYQVLTLRMSQCKPCDSELIDFILIHGQVELLDRIHDVYVSAMCYVLRYSFGFTMDEEREAVYAQYIILKRVHLGFHFQPKIKKRKVA